MFPRSLTAPQATPSRHAPRSALEETAFHLSLKSETVGPGCTAPSG